MSIVLSWIIGFLKIVVVLGTLITIHEGGHFLVAKLCKVRVNKFSIGFGPILLRKQKGETEYTLRLLPFGGFCQMEGEEERSDDPNAFNNKTVWQRIAIVLAGPIVNIVFALILYFFIASAANVYVGTVVTSLSEGPLYEAGIRSGDRIVSVNGDGVMTQREIENIVTKSKEDQFTFVVERQGEKISYPVVIPYEERGFLGVAFSDSGEVVYIYKNSPGAEAGLLVGDIMKKINDKAVSSAQDALTEIRSNPNSKVTFEVERSGEVISLSGETKSSNERFFALACNMITPGFWRGVPYALDETAYYFSATIEGTFGILTGKNLDNVEVMGPVGIAGEITSTKAWSDFFYLMSAISLSLGIFNLLPVPALDGGRIVILLIEAVRRKPMKEKVEQGLIMAGFALIILLALFVTAGDLIKLF